MSSSFRSQHLYRQILWHELNGLVPQPSALKQAVLHVRSFDLLQSLLFSSCFVGTVLGIGVGDIEVGVGVGVGDIEVGVGDGVGDMEGVGDIEVGVGVGVGDIEVGVGDGVGDMEGVGDIEVGVGDGVGDIEVGVGVGVGDMEGVGDIEVGDGDGDGGIGDGGGGEGESLTRKETDMPMSSPPPYKETERSCVEVRITTLSQNKCERVSNEVYHSLTFSSPRPSA